MNLLLLLRRSLLGLVFAPYFVCQAAYAAEPTKAETKPCESDTRTLDELLKSDQPWSKKVPKDFTIEQHVDRYVTVNGTYSYGLPSTTDPSAKKFGSRLGPNYRDKAECKAIGPDGTRWIVENTGGYALIYVLESAVLPEPVYDARATAGNAVWKKCLEENLAQEKAGLIPYNAPNHCPEQATLAEDQAEKELNYGNK